MNVYQHMNAVYDQQYNESHDPEGFFNCFKGLMDRSLNNEVYSFISVKSHNDEYFFSRSPLMKMLDYANQHNIPVWTELKLLDFIKMKDEASFTHVTWVNNKLAFNINSSVINNNGLTCMVPVNFKDLRITAISLDGNNTRIVTRTIKGSEYALITVKSGTDHSIVVSY